MKPLLLTLGLLASTAHAADWLSLHDQAGAELGQRHYAQAAALEQQALAALPAPALPARIANLSTLAAAEAGLHNDADAEAHYRQALALAENLHGAEQTALDPQLAQLAGYYLSRFRFDDAQAQYQRRVAIFEAAYGPDHPAVAERLRDVADLQYRQGHYAQAEPIYQRIIAIYSQEEGAHSRSLVFAMENLAGVEIEAGQYAEAEALYTRVVAAQVATPGLDPVARVMTLEDEVRLQLAMGDHAQAATLDRKAEELRRMSFAIGPAGRANLNPNYGLQADIARLSGHPADAAPLYQTALDGAENWLAGAENRPLPIVLQWGQLLEHAALNSAALGHDDEARQRRRLAQQLYQQALGPDSPELADSLLNQADLLLSRQQPDAAEPVYWQALAMQEKTRGPDHPAVATTLQGLARLDLANHNPDQAEAMLKQALGILESALGQDNAQTRAVGESLQEVLRQEGKVIARGARGDAPGP